MNHFCNTGSKENQKMSFREETKNPFDALDKSRIRYAFASFWNRNHAIRTLQSAAKNDHSMTEPEKKEQQPRCFSMH